MMQYSFVSGSIFSMSLIAALFFLRFHRRTGERLFGIFSVAFLMLAFERLVLEVTDPTAELKPYIYILRLSAFVFIIAGIVEKNWFQARFQSQSHAGERPKLVAVPPEDVDLKSTAR